MRQYLIKYFFPGVAMIGLAFFAGSQKDVLLGLVGFLSFFTVGVMLIVEGRRRLRSKDSGKR